MTSPSSLLVKLSGVNSVIGPVVTMASKRPRTSSFPCRGPYQGAEVIAASVDQSMSPVTRSRMAWTSPRPSASPPSTVQSIWRRRLARSWLRAHPAAPSTARIATKVIRPAASARRARRWRTARARQHCASLLDLIMMSWPGSRPARALASRWPAHGSQFRGHARLWPAPGGIRCAGWLALG